MDWTREAAKYEEGGEGNSSKLSECNCEGLIDYTQLKLIFFSLPMNGVWAVNKRATKLMRDILHRKSLRSVHRPFWVSLLNWLFGYMPRHPQSEWVRGCKSTASDLSFLFAQWCCISSSNLELVFKVTDDLKHSSKSLLYKPVKEAIETWRSFLRTEAWMALILTRKFSPSYPFLVKCFIPTWQSSDFFPLDSQASQPPSSASFWPIFNLWGIYNTPKERLGSSILKSIPYIS